MQIEHTRSRTRPCMCSNSSGSLALHSPCQCACSHCCCNGHYLLCGWHRSTTRVNEPYHFVACRGLVMCLCTVAEACLVLGWRIASCDTSQRRAHRTLPAASVAAVGISIRKSLSVFCNLRVESANDLSDDVNAPAQIPPSIVSRNMENDGSTLYSINTWLSLTMHPL
jgi:hypothetical protein